MRVDPKLALGHKLPKPWDEITESTLCEKEVYMLFAEYVTEVYIIESGDIDEGEVVGSNRAHRTLLEWSKLLAPSSRATISTSLTAKPPMASNVLYLRFSSSANRSRRLAVASVRFKAKCQTCTLKSHTGSIGWLRC